MEMQRHAQLMYTSCGWFFDDIAGIETVQIIAYAARVLQLATRGLWQQGHAPRARISCAPRPGKIQRPEGGRRCANLQEVRRHNGTASSNRWLRTTPSVRSFPRLPKKRIFSASCSTHLLRHFSSGRGRLALGRAHSPPQLPASSGFSFAVLHFGDQNITAAVKVYDPADDESASL